MSLLPLVTIFHLNPILADEEIEYKIILFILFVKKTSKSKGSKF